MSARGGGDSTDPSYGASEPVLRVYTPAKLYNYVLRTRTALMYVYSTWVELPWRSETSISLILIRRPKNRVVSAELKWQISLRSRDAAGQRRSIFIYTDIEYCVVNVFNYIHIYMYGCTDISGEIIGRGLVTMRIVVRLQWNHSSVIPNFDWLNRRFNSQGDKYCV